MFVLEKKTPWSGIGLRLAIWSFAATLLLTAAHAGLEIAELRLSREAAVVLITLCNDLRYLSEQLILVGAVVFVGGGLFETRSIFSVGFDRLDAAKVSAKGPDGDNIVWIGHRYATRLEAQAVAAAIGERLKES